MPDAPDQMQILREARQEMVDELADVLRTQRQQLTEPLPLSGVEPKTKAEQLEDYRNMAMMPELAVAEVARQQQERGIVRPRTILRHLARMQRETERERRNGNA